MNSKSLPLKCLSPFLKAVNHGIKKSFLFIQSKTKFSHAFLKKNISCK